MRENATFHNSLPLLQDSRETRELTVGIVPPPGYDRVSLTPDRVGGYLMARRYSPEAARFRAGGGPFAVPEGSGKAGDGRRAVLYA